MTFIGISVFFDLITAQSSNKSFFFSFKPQRIFLLFRGNESGSAGLNLLPSEISVNSEGECVARKIYMFPFHVLVKVYGDFLHQAVCSDLILSGAFVKGCRWILQLNKNELCCILWTYKIYGEFESFCQWIYNFSSIYVETFIKNNEKLCEKIPLRCWKFFSPLKYHGVWKRSVKFFHLRWFHAC